MCASYGALESTLVSTRSTVPDNFASAAALTLAATSPVNSVSVLPLTVWPPLDGSDCGRAWPLLGAAGGAERVEPEPELEPPVAAPAIAVPPSAAAPTAAIVMSVDLNLGMRRAFRR